jgi:beta-lactamase superfamily II metal-dependent hydrolase
VRVYVEKLDFIPASRSSRRRTLLLDTENIDDNLRLEDKLRLEGKLEQPAHEERSESMLAIEVEAPAWKSMKEGSWYDLDPSLFVSYRPVLEGEEGGTFLRARITGPSRAIDFTEYLSHPNFAQTQIDETGNQVFGDDSPLELAVIDCGQGNWNEVRSPKSILIYDIGASMRYSRAEVEQLVRNRALAMETREIKTFISHWDVDHYQALLVMSNADLSKLGSVTAPSQMPDTSTLQLLTKNLAAAGVKLYSLPPASPTSAAGRRIVLCHDSNLSSSQIQLFRASPGSSRNQTGIVLAVIGPRRTAILTGDHHYSKILEALPAYLPKNPVVMVAPHHGGKAGTFDLSSWRRVFPQMEVAISVGLNSYGHPVKNIETKLSTLQGSTPHITRVSGSRTFPL